MPPLVITALFGTMGYPPKFGEYVLLGNLLDLLPLWYGAGTEFRTVEVGKSFAICQEPGLHDLDHQVELVRLGVGWPVPAITILEMLPRRVCRYRTLGIDKEDRYCFRFLVTSLKVIEGYGTRAAGDNFGHVSRESCFLDKLGEGLAQFGLLLSSVAATFNIYFHPHHLLPPISPFDQSSPSLYLFNQGLRLSLSNRRRYVAPSRFSQTITDSGRSVSASMSMSECVVTTN